jgi:Transglutaminase-like superfamily
MISKPKSKIRLSKLAAAAVLAFAVAVILFIYVTSEGIGIFAGLWWKSESATVTVTRVGERYLVGSHLVGEFRPHALTIENTGRQTLIMPYGTAAGPNPWLSFDRQARHVAGDGNTAADKTARLVYWVRRNVEPGPQGSKAMEISDNPWTMMYAFGSGDCDELSYMVDAAVKAVELPARVLRLPGHAVVEVQYDDGWHVFDPTYGLFFYDDDGRVPSFEQVAAAGGAFKWTDQQRPWMFETLVDSAWRGDFEVTDRTPPPGWDAAPTALMLAPGDSIRFELMLHRELFAGVSGGKNATVSRVDLRLTLPVGQDAWTSPFPLRRVTLLAPEGDRVLLDAADRPDQAIFSVALPAGSLSQSVKLHVEAMAGAAWVPRPQPGVFWIEAGWSAGDRMKLTFEWQRR